MKLGIYTTQAEMQKTRRVPFVLGEYTEADGVAFFLRPWTRTTQELVTRRAKSKNIAIMDADEALKLIGQGDRRGEAFTRELADFLIEDWEGVVYGADVVHPDDPSWDDGNRIPTMFLAKKGQALECTSENKVFLFEDIAVAVWVVNESKKLATAQVADEVKNAERSSGSTRVPQDSQSLTSA